MSLIRVPGEVFHVQELCFMHFTWSLLEEGLYVNGELCKGIPEGTDRKSQTHLFCFLGNASNMLMVVFIYLPK